jgi:replicative DNA helicase
VTSERVDIVGGEHVEEQAVLGCLLSDGDMRLWRDHGSRLAPSLFRHPVLRAIASATFSVLEAGRPADPALVLVELRKTNALPARVAHPTVLALSAAIGTSAGFAYYVSELETLRDTGTADALEGLSLRRALEVEEKHLESETQRIATGWDRLDRRLGGGLAVPSLTVLGAAPKSGKSTWAQIVAEHHVESGGVAYYVDLENGRRLFLRRVICRRARMGARDVAAAIRDVRAGVFKSRDEVERWQRAKQEVWEKLGDRLFVDASPPSQEELAARVAAARRRAGDRPLLVVIDSLQKLPMRLDERRAAVDEWLRRFERIRLEHNAALILISEIKRGSSGYEAREDAFKESGGIEYTADLALTLTRPSADADDDAAAVSTMRVVLARDCDDDPKGIVASYKPRFPWYGLEETEPEEQQRRGPNVRDGDRPLNPSRNGGHVRDQFTYPHHTRSRGCPSRVA